MISKSNVKFTGGVSGILHTAKEKNGSSIRFSDNAFISFKTMYNKTIIRFGFVISGII